MISEILLFLKTIASHKTDIIMKILCLIKYGNVEIKNLFVSSYVKKGFLIHFFGLN